MPRKRKPTPAEAAAAGLVPGAVVWAYLRVSTDSQADKGLPIAGQREAVERYCSEHGYVLTETYSDGGVSARTDHRPEFQRLVEDAQARHPAAIVMWSWSRFSRDQNDALFYKAMLRRHGVELLTASDEIPRVEGFENVLESLIHWRDEWENKARGAATKRGHHALARMGYLPAGDGNLPRGYRSVLVPLTIDGRERQARRVELDPDVAPIVRHAYDMRLAGAAYEEIHTVCQLYAAANDLGTMFRDRTYVGEYNWGVTTVKVPALVTEAEWRQVYDGLAKGRGGGYARSFASDYYLSGLVWCGQCGAHMNGHSACPHGRRYYMYRCWTPDCPVKGVSRARVESSVVALLMDTVLTPRWVADAAERLRARSDGSVEARAGELRHQLERLDRIVANLVAMAEEAGDVREVGARLRERRDERTRVERDLAAVAGEALPAVWARDVDATRERLSAALEAGDRRAAKAIIQLCVERVTVLGKAEWRVRIRGDGAEGA